MEPENSENWSQPDENQTQPGTSQQPKEKSFFQQERLQRTWLNVKVATWLKCLIVIAVLIVAAVVIAPKLTPAQPEQPETQQQDTVEYYSEEDYYNDYYNDYYDDYSDDYYYDD